MRVVLRQNRSHRLPNKCIGFAEDGGGIEKANRTVARPEAPCSERKGLLPTPQSRHAATAWNTEDLVDWASP
jgi:hypothetical protein